MTTYMIMLTIIVLVREYTNYKHDIKRDALIDTLTNKVMAKDFTEYQEAIQPIKTYEPVDNSEEAEWYREQKELRGE